MSVAERERFAAIAARSRAPGSSARKPVKAARPPGKKKPPPLSRAERIAKTTGMVSAALESSPLKCHRDPVIIAALGRAAALTSPGSGHGRLLAALVRTMAAGVPSRELPEPELRVARGLARRGTAPTEAVLADAMRSWRARPARRERLAGMREEAERLAARDGRAAADWVAGVVAATGAGPAWMELARAMGWPGRRTAGVIIQGLAAAGWLVTGSEPRSLRPGPRAVQP